MFSRETYSRRREILGQSLTSGLMLFLGNQQSPMNYADNQYPFRQDSSFLYYWGLDSPGLAAVMDIDSGIATLYGDDPGIGDIVWTGPQPLLRAKADWVGVQHTMPAARLEESLLTAIRQGRPVHFLPPYRPENVLRLQALFGVHASFVKEYASAELTKAVVAQRSVKTPEEIAEIEKAVNITGEMQTAAMKLARAGMVEREIAGVLHGIALARGGSLAFPIIFSVHGETLHNHYHGNVMREGQIVVNDCGAESALHYAGDLTRTIPVGGRFTERQRELYRLVLEAQQAALAAIRPGVRHLDIHLLACRTLAAGLRQLGLMRGDPDEAVEQGAHAMFFQCGLGHMMGLDVHDMEDLGEQHVGYGELQRNPQFGLCYLRMAKALRPGYVITCEPGIYIIPELIDRWKAERRHEQFIDYDRLEQYRDFGGIRIEDDVVVTEAGCRLLGDPVPKTVDAVEALCSR